MLVPDANTRIKGQRIELRKPYSGPQHINFNNYKLLLRCKTHLGPIQFTVSKAGNKPCLTSLRGVLEFKQYKADEHLENTKRAQHFNKVKQTLKGERKGGNRVVCTIVPEIPLSLSPSSAGLPHRLWFLQQNSALSMVKKKGLVLTYQCFPLFSFLLLIRQFLILISAADLGTVDYIAIGTSLGLTVLIVSALVYFLWRGKSSSSMDTSREMGQVDFTSAPAILANQWINQAINRFIYFTFIRTVNYHKWINKWMRCEVLTYRQRCRSEVTVGNDGIIFIPLSKLKLLHG